MSVVVVIPTVPARAGHLAETVTQFGRIGLSPLVSVQAADVPGSPQEQGRNARRAIALGLEAGPGGVLYCEDDVDLSPRLPEALPEMPGWGEMTTLYLFGRSWFWTAGLRREIAAGTLAGAPLRRFAITSQRVWCGAQAIWLPRWLAERVLADPVPDDPRRQGIDTLLKRAVRRDGGVIWSVAPNLVQHRCPRSVTDPRYHPPRSIGFAG